MYQGFFLNDWGQTLNNFIFKGNYQSVPLVSEFQTFSGWAGKGRVGWGEGAACLRSPRALRLWYSKTTFCIYLYINLNLDKGHFFIVQ